MNPTTTTASPSQANPGPPKSKRLRVLLLGGPLRRAVIYPAPRAITATFRIHDEVHLYDLDQAAGRGVYRR